MNWSQSRKQFNTIACVPKILKSLSVVRIVFGTWSQFVTVSLNNLKSETQTDAVFIYNIIQYLHK